MLIAVTIRAAAPPALAGPSHTTHATKPAKHVRHGAPFSSGSKPVVQPAPARTLAPQPAPQPQRTNAMQPRQLPSGAPACGNVQSKVPQRNCDPELATTATTTAATNATTATTAATTTAAKTERR
jgi:hypothetical protein